MSNVKTTINKLMHSKMAQNGAWVYLLQIFNTIVPMLTLPYITRILGCESYGMFSVAVNLYGYLQVVVEFGFGMSTTRKIALMENAGDELSRSFTVVFFARCFLFLLCGVFTSLYCVYSNAASPVCISLIILTIGLFGFVEQQNYLFQGKQDMKYISAINIIVRSLSTVFIFVFVKSEKDIILYSILYAIAPIISGTLGMAVAKKKYDVRFLKITLPEILSEITDSFYVFTTQLSSKVFGAVGVTILGILGTYSEVGAFSAIQKIPTVMIFVWSPIGQVIYPEVSRIFKKSFLDGIQYVNRIRKYVLALFVLFALFVSLLCQTIVCVGFGDEYIDYAFWVIPLALWVVVSINNNFMGSQILLASGHDKEYSKVFQIGVAITVVMNIGLIYFWGGWGAAIAPLVSDIVLGLMLHRRIKKVTLLQTNHE